MVTGSSTPTPELAVQGLEVLAQYRVAVADAQLGGIVADPEQQEPCLALSRRNVKVVISGRTDPSPEVKRITDQGAERKVPAGDPARLGGSPPRRSRDRSLR